MQVLEEEGSISPGLALIRTKRQVIQRGGAYVTSERSRESRERGRKRTEEEIESRRG